MKCSKNVTLLCLFSLLLCSSLLTHAWWDAKQTPQLSQEEYKVIQGIEELLLQKKIPTSQYELEKLKQEYTLATHYSTQITPNVMHYIETKHTLSLKAALDITAKHAKNSICHEWSRQADVFVEHWKDRTTITDPAYQMAIMQASSYHQKNLEYIAKENLSSGVCAQENITIQIQTISKLRELLIPNLSSINHTERPTPPAN